MLEKGFSKPTARVERLKDMIIHARPCVESERAILITESYKETEGLPIIMRRAKAVEKIFNELPVTIRDDELIVGSMTKNPRSAGIYPEFSCEWVEKEFDTMTDRLADPFLISGQTKKELHDVFTYWKGRTVNELAASYMSQEAKDAMASGVFTVGNYFFGGVGHVNADYGKVLKIGFRGILAEAVNAMEKLDKLDPNYVRTQQFYHALIITYCAAITFAHRYAAKAKELAASESDPVRKTELLQIARNCERVPEYGATNFYEACQSFWFVQAMIQIESSGHSVSPGRFDQYMYPYYAADKSLTEDFAKELIHCLWVKFNDVSKIRDEVSAQAFAGYGGFQNLCVGGQTPGGMDASNELSYLCMDACAAVKMPQPSFSIRVWQGTPDEFLYRACELARLGLGVPAMYNDEVIIPALENRGVSLEDARNYALIGCVEPQCPHKTDGWHDAAFVNVAKILEITLNNGKAGGKQLGPVTGDPTEWKSTDDLFAAFKKQIEYFVYYVAEADNCVDVAHTERCPLPFLSALVDDCIATGKSLQEGGAVYNFTGPQAFGVADCGDSVYAIQKNVFEDKNITLSRLKEAMDANFGYSDGGVRPAFSLTEEEIDRRMYQALAKLAGCHCGIDLASLRDRVMAEIQAPPAGDYEYIRRLMDSTPCYGNDIDEIDMIARKCALLYCKEVEKYRNPRGGLFQPGIYPVSANVLFGKDVGAMPDGRLAKQPLADGCSPRPGKDVKGPTAAANSVAKLDHTLVSNGSLYNMKFLPSAIAGDTGLKNFASVVRSYFDHKGQHIQFNVVDRETLLAAQKNPDDYRDLVVRVAGYSAHFVVLAKEVQDDIISRTEQTFR
ncbi:glycyl radical protein [Caproiciproducens sp. R1]|uniref:glycyl radical protein n=1 Tax=Caproiciproducens sp. R1 TaxID=3435000 RepID=UPI0040336485